MPLTAIRTAIAAATLAAILAACRQEAKPDDGAVRAATAALDSLFSGHYDAYLRQIVNTDSLHADYRSQLRAATRQSIARLKETRGAVTSVRPLRQTRDSLAGATYAYVELVFADSTTEEVSVEMVRQRGRWMLLR